MREIPKWLMAWIARLQPKQDNTGDGIVQIGKMSSGSVTIVNLTLPPVPPSVPEPTAAPVAPLPARQAGIANEEQRQVLRLIRRLPHPGPVHEFMLREFGTHMVIHLQPPQLYRVRRYVEAIMKSGAPLKDRA